MDCKKIAEVAGRAKDMQNMPVQVTSRMVIDAIKLVDRLSSENF
ncbi:hypothetical protein SAMN05660649_04397 [Desulfotomaculum arcticum]|uniref:Uncharacterized protein n=1 Tax=Desulfotruncus arcticus DSM 17038 TaxID=1121424 RepID=A0A1I2YG35_9FIRM|nr:glycerol dehydrogenase [Desulfotruncus arcticus]SFH24614.1 hypothetical protein SAMN05660649_04397 [Desulfotomaculum arcticum] [Desulfotruncus arcticus DSM 17038]